MRQLYLFTLFVLITAIGAVLLYQQLDALYREPVIAVEPARFPSVLAGEHFTVPAESGFHRIPLKVGTLLVTGKPQIKGQASVSLCEQQRVPSSKNSPLIPLYIGWDWSRIQEVIDTNLNRTLPRPAHFGLKNPLLDDGAGGLDVPAIVLETPPLGSPLMEAEAPGSELWLKIRDRRPLAGLSDIVPEIDQSAETLVFQRDAWLFWDAAGIPSENWQQALRIQRLPASNTCRFGQLQVTVYGSGEEAVTPNRETRQLRLYARKGEVHTFRLLPGDYVAPLKPPPSWEDAELFTAATASHLIHQDKESQVVVAPADLSRRLRFANDYPQFLTAGADDPWLSLSWDEAEQATHRLLYTSASGRYVRQQIDAFNDQRLLVALRLRPDSVSANPLAGQWQAYWQGGRLSLNHTMPLLAGGLFAELPQGWQPWQRIARGVAELDSTTPIHFTAPLKPVRSERRLQLLVVGQKVRVEGAKVLRDEPRCLGMGSCRGTAVLARQLLLQLRPNAKKLTVQTQPLPARTAPRLFRQDFAHIQVKNETLHWRTLTPAIRKQRGEEDAEIVLRDRYGTLLWDERGLSDTAWEQGLSALVGVHRMHRTSLVGILGRLGEQGASTVEAQLTLDGRMQGLAREALREQLPEVRKRFKAGDPFQNRRFASLVILDADRGEILAAVNNPEPPQGVDWSDLYRFDAAQTRYSPLRLWAWWHDGSSQHVPGSTFKTISALALERDVQQHPKLEVLLDGLPLADIDRHPLSRYGFKTHSPRYPMQRSKKAAVHNFRMGGAYETLAGRAAVYRDQQYGLEQALRDSLNTWFAWLVETTDGTLLNDPEIPGLPHIQALTPDALDSVRPLLATTADLGFGVNQRLDGSLLPDGLLRSGDALLTTASHLDAFHSRHDIRLAALGFRMQVTPLQMALVAASIATEKRVTPRLMLELNGRKAEEPAFADLGIETRRIRAGMKRVPEDGTAKTAFKSKRFDSLRPSIYAKTGTADLSQKVRANNAWLVGWVESGGIPNEHRRLAFACVISHTQGTGGQECGLVVARFLAALAELDAVTTEGDSTHSGER